MFKSTRVNKSRASNNKALDESSVSSSSGRGNDTASGSGSGSTSTPAPLVTRTYAPFPAPYPYAVVTSNPVPMYEPYPAYPQQQLPQIPQPLQSQHPQQLVLLPRPQVPEHILEHQPPHSHYTLAAVTPGNSIRHLPLPTRTPYQNGNRVEYTHDPSVRYMSSALSSSPRIIAGAPPGSAYVPNYPMTTSYGAPGPPDHTMYSSVQSLPPPPPHGPHPHIQQQQQQQQSPSSPWYDEQHQHHPQSSPGPYSGVEPIAPRPGPEYGEQSPSSNSFESPSPVIPTLVPLNLSSVRTPADYTLVDNSHSSTSSMSPMSPMSPVSPTSPTSPMTPLHPMPPTSRIPPMPSMTPIPLLPPPMSSPHPNTPPNPVHSPVYQSVYNIPRGMPSTYSYSSTYTMTPAFQYSPGGAAAANNPATIASIAYMGDRAATPASPSTESSASGSVRSGGSGGSVRSMRSTGSAGSGGSVYVPSSSSLYGPGVPGASSSRASAGDLRTNELVRSAELVRLSEPGLAVGSAGGGGDVAGGGLSGSPQRAVPLPPLHSLKRSHPYRRHPEDDKTLRLLDPRPVPSVP
ncbi:hypothetical protein C8J55DRAFT_315264 [Lentinula edodes]|uniref:Uncharacterized protein n=1 Tax=Lentinula lateritia TaxID=40482 RepID=A0A9W9DWK1_9AGAR|nr:hypothetical protein C8J55DRAFT_315264 [Lentinula edodes]